MKFLPLVVVAVVGMVARVSAADSPQGVTREMAKMGATQLDTNKNGYLDKDEMGGDQAFKPILDSGDANKDGKLSIDEYVDFQMKMAGQGGPGGHGGPGGPPQTMDLNSDGFVTKDEVVTIMGAEKVTDNCWNAMVKRADKNNDKKITEQEFTDALSSGDMPEACTDNPGGASSMKAAFSLLSLLALALRLF